MPKYQLREIKMFAAFHPNCGFWSLHMEASEARNRFGGELSGYKNWETAKANGWKIIPCWMRPVGLPISPRSRRGRR